MDPLAAVKRSIAHSESYEVRNTASSKKRRPTNATAPEFYVVVHNIAKKPNVGGMVRSAVAFGCAQVLIVGSKKKNLGLFGSFGTAKHVEFIFFEAFKECVHYVKTTKNADLCGVEIRNDAKNVVEAFRGAVRSTAFLLGNEGSGIHPAHAAQCDYFVYIPQYGSGTASCNVYVAASIVFHQFASSVGYIERERKGEKYVVADVPKKTEANLTEADLKLRESRRAKRRRAQE